MVLTQNISFLDEDKYAWLALPLGLAMAPMYMT
jgi:hypothetical protein